VHLSEPCALQAATDFGARFVSVVNVVHLNCPHNAVTAKAAEATVMSKPDPNGLKSQDANIMMFTVRLT